MAQSDEITWRQAHEQPSPLSDGADNHVTLNLGSVTLDLPDIESFDPDEALLARMSVGIVRAGGAMFTGRLLECRVARLLGASFPVVGISPWDLVTVEGVRIEVRSGSTSFSLRGTKDVDCWVFVHKLEELTPYSVAIPTEVTALRAKSVSAKKVSQQFGQVAGEQLAEGVADAIRRGRGERESSSG